jgi:hypothetical protein
VKKIKSFLYLDEYKMYSISSQVFEGLTEYVISYSANASQNLEKQEGPIGSGRVLAEIISQNASQGEKKFLHDYAYTLFEQKLFDDKRVVLVDSGNIDTVDIYKLENFAFIKVVGRMLFNDINMINATLENFNNIGEAIAYISNFEEIQKVEKEHNDILDKEKDRNKKAFLNKAGQKAVNISQIAKNMNLHYDKKFLEKLSLVLNYGYNDQFEVQTSLLTQDETKITFSANLKRDYLKEDESLLIKKHSRYSEKELVIFGMITQSQGKTDKPYTSNQNSPKDMKEALLTLTLGLSDVEEKFVGKLDNEIIIDPIAVYQEL